MVGRVRDSRGVALVPMRGRSSLGSYHYFTYVSATTMARMTTNNVATLIIIHHHFYACLLNYVLTIIDVSPPLTRYDLIEAVPTITTIAPPLALPLPPPPLPSVSTHSATAQHNTPTLYLPLLYPAPLFPRSPIR